MTKEIEVIEAYGMKTKVWCFKNGSYGCDECCNKDRCDEDCNRRYRPNCPHCKGKGWIPESEVTNSHQPDKSKINK